MTEGLGREGESRACTFLRRKGYSIRERNYRSPYGEVDIIAFKGGALVFCEVKARSGAEMTDALEAVDWRKRDRITKAASHYLAYELHAEGDCRFDVIALCKSEDNWKIEHVKNAFEMGGL